MTDEIFSSSEPASDHLISELAIRRVVLPFDAPLRTATSAFDAAYLLIVDVTTSSGVQGIGWTFAFSRAHLDALEHLVRHISPFVEGESALDVAARWSDMRAALERPGAVGSGAMAMAAVDIALWDVLGKVAGLPVATLLGGHRREAESYDSFGLWADLDLSELKEDALRIVTTGARALKLRVGGRSLSEDVARASAVRDAIGSGTPLMLDANSSCTVKQAIRLAEALAELEIEWLEDPVPVGRPSEMAMVRSGSPIPVCGGEGVYLEEGLDLAVAFPFDVAMIDVFRTGGITGFVRVANALALHGIPVTPHLDTPSGIHLVCGLENAIWIEHLSWWERLFLAFPAVEDGVLVAPTEPGLGLVWADDLDRFVLTT